MVKMANMKKIRQINGLSKAAEAPDINMDGTLKKACSDSASLINLTSKDMRLFYFNCFFWHGYWFY